MDIQPVFITGIGTGIGKTVVAAIVAEALHADYWKPVEAGFAEGTDSELVQQLTGSAVREIHPETYKLKMPASPHIAARNEGIIISLDKIEGSLHRLQDTIKQKYHGEQYTQAGNSGWLVIEGAGGLMVPLNGNEFVADLIKKIHARVILVSRNYLGSINHSLLAASVCRQYQLDVIGWIFNDQYLAYEQEIAAWSGFPKIAAIPFSSNPDKAFIQEQAQMLRPSLLKLL